MYVSVYVCKMSLILYLKLLLRMKCTELWFCRVSCVVFFLYILCCVSCCWFQVLLAWCFLFHLFRHFRRTQSHSKNKYEDSLYVDRNRDENTCLQICSLSSIRFIGENRPNTHETHTVQSLRILYSSESQNCVYIHSTYILLYYIRNINYTSK